MGNKDNTVLKEMIVGMVLYGIILQIVCLIVPGDHLRMSAGGWLGVLTGIGMAIHMKASLDEAVDRPEGDAQKYLQKRYAARYTTVIVVFVAAAWLDLVNIMTLFFGVMSLKLSAYLQPLLHKILSKL